MIRESAGLIRFHPDRNSRKNDARYHSEPARRNTVVHQESAGEISFHQYASE
jgi:hypothetical protein